MYSDAERGRLGGQSSALVIGVLALVVSLTGSAWAAFGEGTFERKKQPRLRKGAVGTRQLKTRSVRTGKIANSAVTGSKVAAGTLTGADINLRQLGVVPRAGEARNAREASTVGGHSAVCPGGSTLIRGGCYDLALSGPVAGVRAAAAACAAKGGRLPSPMRLYSVRNVINLGTVCRPRLRGRGPVLRQHGRSQQPDRGGRRCRQDRRDLLGVERQVHLRLRAGALSHGCPRVRDARCTCRSAACARRRRLLDGADRSRRVAGREDRRPDQPVEAPAPGACADIAAAFGFTGHDRRLSPAGAHEAQSRL